MHGHLITRSLTASRDTRLAGVRSLASVSTRWRSLATACAGVDITLENVASFNVPADDPATSGGLLPGTIITGADVSPDGNVVLVRTYSRVLAFVRPEGAPLDAAFGVDLCSAPQADERQGEAVGFAADGSGYFTISEGVYSPIHHVVAN